MASMGRDIAIFWDYESFLLPPDTSPAAAAKAIRRQVVPRYGKRIVKRNVYFDPEKAANRPRNRGALQSSGFQRVEIPSRNSKATVIVDVMSFALGECKEKGVKPCVVLITSDGDYSYTLATLTRDYDVMNVVIFGRDCLMAEVLKSNADVALSFEGDVLPSTDSSIRPMMRCSTNSDCYRCQGEMNLSSSDMMVSKSMARTGSDDQKLPTSSSKSQTARTGSDFEHDETIMSVYNLPPRVQKEEMVRFFTNKGLSVVPAGIQLSNELQNFARVRVSSKAEGDKMINLAKSGDLKLKDKDLVADFGRSVPSGEKIDDGDRKLCALIDRNVPGNSFFSELPIDSKYARYIIGFELLAFCVCLMKKQGFGDEGAIFSQEQAKRWVSVKSVEDLELKVTSFDASKPTLCQKMLSGTSKQARDQAHKENLVEFGLSAKKDDRQSYVVVGSFPDWDLLQDLHLRFTPTGRDFIQNRLKLEVKAYCACLHKKQAQWEKGNPVALRDCWIPSNVINRSFRPTFLTDERKVPVHFTKSICKGTRDSAISMGLVETARKTWKGNQYEQVDLGQTHRPGLSQKEFYLRLTAEGFNEVDKEERLVCSDPRVLGE